MSQISVESRILTYGNSGSGKTTMARRLAARHGLAWLSLDDIAWTVTHGTPQRRPMEACGEEMSRFMREHTGWVMDGCYGDLIRFALPWSTELRFLNPGVEACLKNCAARPWEPDKYASAEEQEAMLGTLKDWVRAYGEREDDCSLRQHRKMFDEFEGPKAEYRSLEAYPE